MPLGKECSAEVSGIKFALTSPKEAYTHYFGDYVLTVNGNAFCYYGAWAYSSCAAATLCGFGRFYQIHNFLSEKKNVDALIEFLDKHIMNAGGAYIPHEVYVLLSGTQTKSPAFKGFLEHPCVRQIDAYKNKAHDSSGVNLFRLSIQKDFKFHDKAG